MVGILVNERVSRANRPYCVRLIMVDLCEARSAGISEQDGDAGLVAGDTGRFARDYSDSQPVQGVD
jgi:hypothetical protein